MAVNKKLIIVESPAKAHTIEKFLGRNYKVEASNGHVRDLPKSRLGIDPEQDFRMDYITIHGKGDVLKRLRKEVKSASEVFLATDPDREGEAISWHLAQALKLDPTETKRVEFHEITKKAVTDAVKKPRHINMDLVDAQQTRRALDRLVGYKISPLLWAKVRKGLSAGRVQSVATRMVVDRENEIDAFIPEEYWDIEADVQVKDARGKTLTLKTKLSSLKGKRTSITNEQEAQAAEKLVRKQSFAISAVKVKEKRKTPAAPFTTSTLQQEASRKLNFQLQKTMQVVQGLYEGVDLGKEGTQGLVTYIRTDSVRVSDEAILAGRAAISAAYGEDHLPKEPRTYKGRNSAQDAHEAIRPTDPARTPDSIKAHLSKEQYQLYRLIYARFLSSQMADAVYDTVTMEISGKEAMLRYYGEHKSFAGYTAVYEEGADEAEEKAQSRLPECKENDPVTLMDVMPQQHFTQPPARYTEASLVKALEDQGIGRPSTYAPTVSTIIGRGYVAKEKKRLYATELGRMVTGLMVDYFGNVVDVDFTAQMEEELDRVEAGDMAWQDVLRGFYPGFETLLERAEKDIEKIELEDEKSDIPCDKCGAMMVYKHGRYGKFLACPNFPDCRNTMPILEYIGVPCPSCGAQLLEKTSRKNRKFYGCERYPDCDFVAWDRPVEKKCPACDGYMVLKRRKNDAMLLCANEACRHREPYELPDEEQDA